MNLRRTFALTGSNLKRTLREPAYLFLVLMFPIALTVLFGTAFGAMGSGSATYKVGVVDLDGPDGIWSEALNANLSATMIVSVQPYDDDAAAQKDLSEGKLQAVLVIPSGFGAACSAYILHPDDPSAWTSVEVHLYLDPASMVSTQAVPPLIDRALTATVYGAERSSGPIAVGAERIAASSHLTAFDQMAPGVITFAAVFLIMIVGQSFAADRENGVLRRMSATPVRPSEVIISNVLSNMVIAVLQLAIVFVLIMALGFHSAASTAGLALAFVLVLSFSVCSVGFGLITAAVSRTSSQATMVAFVFIMPQMFLGTFMGSTLSGAAQSAGMVLPAYYVTDGLSTLLLRGAPLTSPSVMTNLVVVIAFAVAALLAGTLLLKHYGSR